MNIGIFGTGVVGQTIAAALAAKGHTVMIGTRDPKATLERDSGNAFSKTPFRDWQAANPAIRLGTFAETARFAEAIVTATSGDGALPALEAAGAGA
jgi:predicted dinucleotide-binding enzyme